MNVLSSSPHKPVIYWLLIGCFFIYLMVLIGGLTRLTHSGLSITDWSFMGSVPPINEQMWTERFDAYKKSPEFLKVNFEMTLRDFKPIFLWEYIHRMTGRLMMYVFVLGFVWFTIKGKIKKNVWPHMGLLFVMGAMQAVIGWWMVYSGLQSKPAVSHYRLAVHLMSAFTLFAFTFWFALKLAYNDREQKSNDHKHLRLWAVLFFAILILQIVYGAFTAGFVEADASKIRPGYIFNTWPKMGDQWIADQVFMKAGFFENVLENPSGIQFVHRSLAFVLVLLVGVLWYKSNKLNLGSAPYLGVTLLIYGITIQFLLGVFTLLYQVPIVMGALHQTGAFFLFAASIYLLFHLFKKNTTN
jgi:heme a synthase